MNNVETVLKLSQEASALIERVSNLEKSRFLRNVGVALVLD